MSLSRVSGDEAGRGGEVEVMMGISGSEPEGRGLKATEKKEVVGRKWVGAQEQ